MEAGESVVQDQTGIKETLSGKKKKKAETNYQNINISSLVIFPKSLKNLTLEIAFTDPWA